MPAVVIVFDVIIALLLVTIVNIVFFGSPVWTIAIPLVILGIIFLIWLIRKIDDMRD